MGGAERDRFFKIAAHTHAQLRKPVALGDFGEKREMQTWFLVDRWKAHETDNVDTQFLTARTDEAVRLRRQYARLLRFLARVHLDEKFEQFLLLSHLLAYGPGKLRPIDRVDAIEQSNRVGGLVRLQGSDEMKL